MYSNPKAIFGTIIRKKIPAATEKRIDKILSDIGRDDVTFLANVRMPNGMQSWFEAPRLGAPFDQQAEHEVISAMRAAGLRYW